MADNITDKDSSLEQGNVRDIALPTLREEIDLHDGPAEADGYPTWTLHDPITGQFFRLGWQGFEVLRRLDKFLKVGQLLDDVNTNTTLIMSEQDVLNIIRFLYDNELAQSMHPRQAERLAEKSQKRHTAKWKQMMHSYLFLRIPLVRPDKFLENTKAIARPFFTRSCLLFMSVLAVVGGFLTLLRADEFANTFMHFFSWQGLAIYILALVFVKICHELAHAYSAKLSGVEVSVMGLAFIVLYPVLYTDTSGAWKITDKRRRLQIGYAGVMAEFYLASCALMLWHVVPEGSLKSAAFFIATVSFAMTLLVNFNPLMRFDGYYLLSDILGIDNLQTRAFALTKWHLRRWLLGVKVKKPEEFRPALHKTVIFYGYATWIYRFCLFTAIAVFIFYLFPQPLGMIFMLIELGFFIALPVMRELKIWWMERHYIPVKGRSVLVGVVFIALFFMALPWHASIEVPAIMQAQAYQKLNTPVAARIEKINVEHGQYVKKGSPLLVLVSDTLDNQIQQVQLQIDMLSRQINAAQRNKFLIQDRQALISRQSETKTRLSALLDAREKLTLRSNMNGQVFFTQDVLHEGLWLPAGESIMEVVDAKQKVLYAYVNERDYNRIQPKATGTFYPDNVLHAPLPAMVQDIDTVSTQYLNYPELASRYGGPIAVEENEESGKLVSHSAIYRVRMIPEENLSSLEIPVLRIRGAVIIGGQGESIIYRGFRHIRAVIMREFGI